MHDRHHRLTRYALPALLTLLLAPAMTFATSPHSLAAELAVDPLDELFAVDNGSARTAIVDGQPVIQWRINAGQTSVLRMRTDHPLFGMLRYYEWLDLDMRVASGEIAFLRLEALGHVTGPRRYKVHNFNLGLVTTERGVWHARSIDLGSPYWFPWDNPDGHPGPGFFEFQAMAITQDTVVELRAPTLLQALVYVKPDFETPITWPLKTRNEDGSVTYVINHRVLNTSGRATDITAALASRHERFDVSIEPQSATTQSGKAAAFTITATLAASQLADAPELYHEPLEVHFGVAHEPDVSIRWLGRLVKPLPESVKTQVFLPQSDVDILRQAVAAEDEALLKAIGLPGILADADAFLEKRLLVLPANHNHVSNGYPGPWRPGDFMPEIVNTATGERQIGTQLAGRVWKEYLAFAGKVTMNLGLAYVITQDEKYAEKAIELMTVYADQYAHLPWFSWFDVPHFLGRPMQISSRYATNSSYGTNWQFKWICMMLSMVSESPAWTPEAKQKIYDGWVLPFVTELNKLPGSISNQTDISNHDLLLVGLVFDDATAVHAALFNDAGLIKRLQDIDADGFSSEGRPLNYHHAAMDEYLPSVTHLINSGLDVPLGKERILNALRMPYLRATLSGMVPNAGHSGRGQRVGPSRLADILVPLAPDAQWLQQAGQASTISAKIRRHQAQGQPVQGDWRDLLASEPTLFSEAGFAILRQGDVAEEQIMATFDFGRAMFHMGPNRGQITLNAFNKVFTHGPGTLYNAGSGGIQYNDDPKLRSFISDHTINYNVVAVNQENQLPTVGNLVAWSDDPDQQIAVAELAGLSPGVTHTRAVMLTRGVVILLDRMVSESENTFDFIYHNFGELTPGAGWTAQPHDALLADRNNWGNVVEPHARAGDGPLRLDWNLTDQVNYTILNQEAESGEKADRPHIGLAFWQIAPQEREVFTGKTGLNNSNTNIMADATPTVFVRTKGQRADYLTVLEPHRGEPTVTSVERGRRPGELVVTFRDGQTLTASIEGLIAAAKQ